MESIVCPRRGQKRVDLTVCVGICELKDECEEFREVPEQDVKEALSRFNNLPVLGGLDLAEGEIVEPEVVEESEERQDDAGSLLTRALTLRNDIEWKFWEFGEILYKIFTNQYYIEYGYLDWKSFCNNVLDIKWRTATYLKDIYGKFSTLGVKPEEFIGIGWVKLKELLPIIDKKNAKDWIKEAKKKSMTVDQLRKQVKLALGRITEEEAKEISYILQFKLYEEQMKTVKTAFEIAKRMTGSENNGYLFEMICTEFRITYEALEEGKGRLSIAGNLLDRIEKIFSVRFQGDVVDVKTGEFIRKN